MPACACLPVGRVGSGYALCELTRLHYIGCLRSLWTFGNFEFYLLSCTKRLKAVPRDSRIMHKYIVSAGLLDESISLFCVKPLYNPFCQDFALLFQNGLYPLRIKPQL